MIDLESARGFVRAVELGSISKAAEEMFVSRASLKRRVDALESSLGARLLERDTRGVEPTSAGRTFLEDARRLLEQEELLERHVAEAAEREGGRTFRIAYYSDFVFPVIQYCIDAYRAAEPRDTIVPVFTEFSLAYRGLRDGTFDVAFCPRPRVSDSVGLASTLLYFTRICALLTVDNPLARAGALTAADLAQQDVAIHPLWYAQEGVREWRQRAHVPMRPAPGGADAMQEVCTRGGVYLFCESDALQFPFAFVPLADDVEVDCSLVYPEDPAPGVADFARATRRYISGSVDPATLLLETDWSHRPGQKEEGGGSKARARR